MGRIPVKVKPPKTVIMKDAKIGAKIFAMDDRTPQKFFPVARSCVSKHPAHTTEHDVYANPIPIP